MFSRLTNRSWPVLSLVLAASRLVLEPARSPQTAAWQFVVKIRRRTEADDAPGSQGAKRENTGSI